MVFIMQKKEVMALVQGKLGWKNYAFAACYYCILGIIFFGLHHFGILHAYIHFLLTKKDFVLTILFVVSFGIFLMLAFLQAMTLSVKPIDELPPTDPAFLAQIAVIIPCHNSADCLADTLARALLHFTPQQIFVADNNRTPWPTDNAPLISEEFGVNYRYFPKPGKTNALFQIGAELLEDYKYFFLLDDDTCLPECLSLDPRVFLENHRVAGMGLGIRIKERGTLSQLLADWEYKCLSTRWSVVSQVAGTAKMAHGIAVLYRAESFMIIYEKNPARTRLPFGEDGWSGMIARQQGMHIIQDAQNYVETFAPSRMFYNFRDLDWTFPSLSSCWTGFLRRAPCCTSPPMITGGPIAAKKASNQISGYDATNMWKQRALRWYRNYPKRIHLEIGLCFTYNAGGLLRNIVYRLFFLYSVLLVYWSLSIPITLATLSVGATSPRLFAYYSVLVYVCGIGCVFLQNNVVFRQRPDLQFTSWKVPLLYPLFTLYIAVMRCFGAIGGMLYYVPFRNYSNESKEERAKRKLAEERPRPADLDQTETTFDATDRSNDPANISASSPMPGNGRFPNKSGLSFSPIFSAQVWANHGMSDDDESVDEDENNINLNGIARISNLMAGGFGNCSVSLDEFDDLSTVASSSSSSRKSRVTFSEVVHVVAEKPPGYFQVEDDFHDDDTAATPSQRPPSAAFFPTTIVAPPRPHQTSAAMLSSSGTSTADVISMMTEKHRRRESFWRLVRILFDFLRENDPDLYIHGKMTVEDCVQRFRNGDPCYQALSSATKSRLRLLIPPIYWKLARREQRAFLGRPKPPSKVKAASSFPSILEPYSRIILPVSTPTCVVINGGVGSGENDSLSDASLESMDELDDLELATGLANEEVPTTDISEEETHSAAHSLDNLSLEELYVYDSDSSEEGSHSRFNP